jgi:hypothetical protein
MNKNDISIETKYRVASCLVVSCLIFGVISITALYIAIPNIPKNQYDYNGVLVSALSLITALLIGWNIYSVIDMKNLKEEAERRVDKLVEERMGDMYVCLLSYVDSSNVDSYLMTKHPEMAIDFLFTALDSSARRIYNIPAINNSMNRLYAICKNNSYKTLNIYKHKKNHYLSILNHINHDYKDYVVSVISESNEILDCPYGKGETFIKA